MTRPGEPVEPTVGCGALLPLILLAVGLLLLAPVSAEPLANVSTDEDAEGELAAVSLHGNASCEGKKMPVVSTIDSPCAAVSGTGSSSCSSFGCVAATVKPPGEPVNASAEDDVHGKWAAASLEGNATCRGRGILLGFFWTRVPCVAASGTGSARCESFGCIAASGTGRAEGRDVFNIGAAVSGTGTAVGLAAVSGTGDAYGREIAVSGLGNATSAGPAASVGGDAHSLDAEAVSVLGDAHGSESTLSVAGNATSDDGIALAPLGEARGAEGALSATGDARAWWRQGPAASGLGNASGERLAVSGAGDASADRGLAVAGLGNASGREAALSPFGNASAEDGPALSVTGDANGTLLAASGTGEASADCQAHPPIAIVGDRGPAGFAIRNPATGDHVPRPGSGVVAGNGTQDDPYVIAGWCIWEADVAIRLVETKAHVVIEDNDLRTHRTAVELVGAENVTLRNNTMSGPGDSETVGPGVKLDETRRTHLEANTIRGHGAGVSANETQGSVVGDNIVIENEEAGIRLENSSQPRVDGNRITWSSAPGIALDNVTGAELVDNEVRYNWRGILLRSSEDVDVDGNWIARNAGFGIVAPGGDEASESLRIEDNLLRDNEIFGVAAFETRNLEVRNNRLLAPGWWWYAHNLAGVYAKGTEDTVVTGNEISGYRGWSWFTRAGVVLSEANDTRMTDNEIQNNRKGVRTEEATNLTIQANRFSDNGQQAILLQQETVGVEVRDNRLVENGNGVKAVGDSRAVTVEDNRIRGSTWSGVHVGRSAGLVQSNTIEDNGQAGIRVSRTDGTLELRGNELAGNPVDLRLVDSHGIEAKDNAMTSGVALVGDTADHYQHTLPASNTVAGQPLRYVHDAEEALVEPPAGQVLVVSSRNVTVAGVDTAGEGKAVKVLRSENTTVEESTLSAAGAGVLVRDSQGTVVRSTTVENGTFGVEILDSRGTTVERSRIANVSWVGVGVDETPEARIEGNTFDQAGNATIVQASPNASVHGNEITDSANGTFVLGSKNASIQDNDVSGLENVRRGDGIGVGVAGGSGHRIADNDIAHGFVDLYLGRTLDAQVWNNTMHRGVYVYAQAPAGWEHEVTPNNTVGGDPLRYVLDDRTNVTGSAGQVVVADAENVTVEGAETQGAVVGVLGWRAHGLEVHNASLKQARRSVDTYETEKLTLANSTLVNATYGLIHDGAQPTVLRTSIEDTDTAVWLFKVDQPRIEETTVRRSRIGLDVFDAEGGLLADNDLNASLLDVNLAGASDLTLIGNEMQTGLRLLDYVPGGPGDHEIDDTNTVGGQPLRYVEGAEDATVASGAGQVVLADARNVTIEPQTIEGTFQGISVFESDGIDVESPEISDAVRGLRVDDGMGAVNVTDAHVSSNRQGIWVDDADVLRISESEATDNGQGIVVWDTFEAHLRNNTVRDNDGDGVWLEADATPVVLRDNLVASNGLGIALPSSEGAQVHDNNLEDNGVGVTGSSPWPSWRIDATHNWWGCSAGPDEEVCDDAVGGRVDYEPWLTAPNPEAGAG